MADQGPLSGRMLGGKYLLGEVLGEGGFGVVYAGHHQLLDRPQAIKVLHEHYFRKPKFRERFLREARTLAALDHPYIVHIDDFGMEEQELRAYLVMPFIGGGTFHDLLQKRQGALSVEQVVVYLEQICGALDYAHQRGVVHLDLKPLNLLVHEDGRLLLSDFGLAHLLKQEVVEGGTSLKLGTPHYMAPEHINGQPGKSSDVYALGVMLYQMLVGRRPFEGHTPESIMIKHIMEQPPPLHTFRSGLPLELEEVLQKVLAKSGEQRYQSAGELLEAFKTALTHAQDRVRKAEEGHVRKAQEERFRKTKEEQAQKAEQERLRRLAEEEQARKTEEERIQKAVEERLRQMEEERLRKTREEQARRTEEIRLHKAEEAEQARKAEEVRTREAMEALQAEEESLPQSQSSSDVSEPSMGNVSGSSLNGWVVAVLMTALFVAFFFVPFDLPLHIDIWGHIWRRFAELGLVYGSVLGVILIITGISDDSCGFIISGVASLIVAAACLALLIFVIPLALTFWGQVFLIGLLIAFWLPLFLLALAEGWW